MYHGLTVSCSVNPPFWSSIILIPHSDPVCMSPVPVPAVLRWERLSSLQSLGEGRLKHKCQKGENRIASQMLERNPLADHGTTLPPPHHTPHTHTDAGDQGLGQGSLVDSDCMWCDPTWILCSSGSSHSTRSWVPCLYCRIRERSYWCDHYNILLCNPGKFKFVLWEVYIFSCVHILHDTGRGVAITLGDGLIITPDPGQEAGREGGGGRPGVSGEWGVWQITGLVSRPL